MGCLFEGSGLICILNTKYNIQNACQYFFPILLKKVEFTGMRRVECLLWEKTCLMTSNYGNGLLAGLE
jgi:hypothetical protein